MQPAEFTDTGHLRVMEGGLGPTGQPAEKDHNATKGVSSQQTDVWTPQRCSTA